MIYSSHTPEKNCTDAIKIVLFGIAGIYTDDYVKTTRGLANEIQIRAEHDFFRWSRDAHLTGYTISADEYEKFFPVYYVDSLMESFQMKQLNGDIL